MTTIILADDHRIVRQGLRALLETESDFRLVSETGDGLEAVQLAQRLQPDVVVLDLVMSGVKSAFIPYEYKRDQIRRIKDDVKRMLVEQATAPAREDADARSE